MKLFRRFFIAMTIDAVMAYCFYLWKLEGVSGAGNVVQFFFWGLVALAILMVLAPYPEKIEPKSSALSFYAGVTSFAFLGTFVWFEHYALAACFLVAELLVAGQRDKYDDLGRFKSSGSR